MNIKALRKVMFLIFGVVLLGQIQEVFPQKVPLEPVRSGSKPTLYTEKTVYSFGDDVRINASGFRPFELVVLAVRRSDESALNTGAVAEWPVIADEKGAFTSIWAVAYPGAQFTIEAVGSGSKASTEVVFIVATHTADLDQCRNGTLATPETCAGANWVNGDLNASQAHYVEGQSVPYRMLLGNLTLGIHTITVEWDTTVGGKHALDYLTSYNRTEATADPCSDIAGCNPALFSTRAIPIDPEVAKGPDGILGTADDVTQAPGVFTLYGGNITQVSGYTMDGTFADTSKTRVTVTFTATSSSVILAWGAHIATRQDWGVNFSAIAISGAPYHMRVWDFDGEGGGNQDRSVQSGAVYYPGKITIIKDAQPNTADPFSFTAVGPSVFNFTLDDDGNNANTYTNTQVFDQLTNFGATDSVTVTEGPSNGFWYLTQINCTSEPNGGSGTNNNSTSIQGQWVEIVLEEGEFVTCTFVNAVVTAAPVSIAGRVTDANGLGIPSARVILAKASTGERVQLITNPFGYYRFADIDGGEIYVISVSAKGFLFDPETLVVTADTNLADVDFHAMPR